MIYLNNATTSYPKPENVLERVFSYISKEPFHSARKGFSSENPDIIFECRKNIASLIDCSDPDQIIFTSGATESLNLAIKGSDLSGKHVITTATEHNSVLRPLKTLERDGVIELSVVTSDKYGFISPDDVKKVVKKTSCMLVVNHVSNVTGAIQNVDLLSNIAHENGMIFLVDGAQSVGNIELSVKKSNIDILTFTGHKSLFGIQGTGGLFINENIKLSPLKTGGTGVRSDLLYQPEDIPMKFEAGTPNLPGIVSIKAGIDFIKQQGIEKIRKRKCDIICRIVEELSSFENIHFHLDTEKADSFSLLSFNIDNMEPSDLGYILENSFGIITRSGLHCTPLIHKCIGTFPEGSVRISPSYFNTDEEIDTLINSIIQISESLTKLR